MSPGRRLHTLCAPNPVQRIDTRWACGIWLFEFTPGVAGARQTRRARRILRSR
jgi:hypothetical protein